MQKLLSPFIFLTIVSCASSSYKYADGTEFSKWNSTYVCWIWDEQYATNKNGEWNQNAEKYFGKICFDSIWSYIDLMSDYDDATNTYILKDNYIDPKVTDNYMDWVSIMPLEEYELNNPNIEKESPWDGMFGRIINDVIEEYPEAKARAKREAEIRRKALIEGERKERARCSGNNNC